MTYDADLNLLVCEHVTSALWRERSDGSREIARVPLRGQVPEQPERRLRPLVGRDLLLRPVVRPVPGVRASSASASSVGRACSGSRRAAGRRARARRRQGRVRHAERPLLLAGRVAPVHQRHAARAHQGLGRGRGREHLERSDVLRGRRLRRHRGGHPGRDEVRRAREHLGDRAGRDLGDLGRGRAPRDDPRAREHREPHVGRRGLAHALHPELHLAVLDPTPSSARAASRTCG